MELGDLEREGRVDLLVEEALEQRRLGIVDRLPGNLHPADRRHRNRAVILHRIALTRGLGGQDSGQLLDRRAFLGRGKQHHIPHADLVIRGRKRRRQAGFLIQRAADLVEGAFGRGDRCRHGAAKTRGLVEIGGQLPGLIGGGIGHQNRFRGDRQDPHLALGTDARTDLGTVIGDAASAERLGEHRCGQQHGQQAQIHLRVKLGQGLCRSRRKRMTNGISRTGRPERLHPGRPFVALCCKREIRNLSRHPPPASGLRHRCAAAPPWRCAGSAKDRPASSASTHRSRRTSPARRRWCRDGS